MFEETFFNTGELKLRVMRGKSNKSPLLFLHGLGETWRAYKRMMSDLAPDWDTYAIDFRGHGKSDRAETYYMVDYIG